MRLVLARASVVYLLLAGMPAQSQEIKVYPQRWVYAPINPGAANGVEQFQSVVDTAAAHGLNGIILNGSFDGNVWTSAFKSACLQMRKIAEVKGIEIIPAVFGLGYGAGKGYDPNLMEGLPVKDQLFVVNDKVGRLVPDPAPVLLNGGLDDPVESDNLDGWTQSAPGVSSFIDRTEFHSGGASLRIENFNGADDRTVLIQQKVQVLPNRLYRLSFWTKSERLWGDEEALIRIVGQDGRFLAPREDMTANRPWTKITVGFNSWENTEIRIQAGAWSGAEGRLWLDDFQLEEVGLTNILRRPGTPVTVKSEASGVVYTEGVDYARITEPRLTFQFDHEGPNITIPAGSRIQEGERLRVSYYHGMWSFTWQVSTCLSEEAVYDVMAKTAANVNSLFAPKRWLLFMDELRAGGTCDACRRRGLSMSQILADSMLRQQTIVRALRPDAEFVTWSDMFDPNHNARPRYYLVDGDLSDVADMLPRDLTIMAWEVNRRKKTLPFFDSLGFRTMAATYYDTNSLDTTLDWLNDLYGTPGADGLMYTTWSRDYRKLADFGDLVSGTSPSKIPLEHLTLEPSTIQGGQSSTANTVTLTEAAPESGAVVALRSSNAIVAAVPLIVMVPAGQTSTTFNIATRGVGVQTGAVISATSGEVTHTSELTVLPVKLAALSLPAITAANVPVSMAVSIDTPAPPGGVEVTLTSSNPDVLAVPASLAIAAGMSATAFKATPAWPGAPAAVVLTAQLGESQINSTVQIAAGQLASLTTRAAVVGGIPSVTNRVYLTGAAAAPVTVKLTSSNPDVGAVPESVDVAAGATWAAFSLIAPPVAAPASVDVAAELDGIVKTSTITIQPASLSAISPGYTPWVAGTTVNGSVQLNGPTGPDGATVALASSDPSLAAVPESTFVAAGKGSSSFPITLGASGIGQTVTLTATYRDISKTASAPIVAVALRRITIPASVVAGTVVQTSSVQLTGPAREGGATVTLTSSDASAASVPGELTVPAGATTAVFTITTTANVTSPGVTITASVPGGSVSATMQVTAPVSTTP